MVDMEIFVQAGKRAQRLRDNLATLSFRLREVEVHDRGSVININLGGNRIGLRGGVSPWTVEPNSPETRERARLLKVALSEGVHQRMDVSDRGDVRVTHGSDLIKVIAYLLELPLSVVLSG